MLTDIQDFNSVHGPTASSKGKPCFSFCKFFNEKRTPRNTATITIKKTITPINNANGFIPCSAGTAAAKSPVAPEFPFGVSTGGALMYSIKDVNSSSDKNSNADIGT